MNDIAAFSDRAGSFGDRIRGFVSGRLLLVAMPCGSTAGPPRAPGRAGRAEMLMSNSMPELVAVGGAGNGPSGAVLRMPGHL